SDGAHEPPPLREAGDGFHDSVARHDVYQRQPGARDRALRWRCLESRPSGHGGGAAGQDRIAMSFLAGVQARAAASVRRIAFAESADERTREAIRELARRRVVWPVVVLDPLSPETHDD